MSPLQFTIKNTHQPTMPCHMDPVKKKNYDDNPSIPIIIIPARSGQRVQPSNRPSNSSWPPKVLHRFEAGDLDFHVVFFSGREKTQPTKIQRKIQWLVNPGLGNILRFFAFFSGREKNPTKKNPTKICLDVPVGLRLGLTWQVRNVSFREVIRWLLGCRRKLGSKD